jgi:hypothetical protein
MTHQVPVPAGAVHLSSACGPAVSRSHFAHGVAPVHIIKSLLFSRQDGRVGGAGLRRPVWRLPTFPLPAACHPAAAASARSGAINSTIDYQSLRSTRRRKQHAPLLLASMRTREMFRLMPSHKLQCCPWHRYAAADVRWRLQQRSGRPAALQQHRRAHPGVFGPGAHPAASAVNGTPPLA